MGYSSDNVHKVTATFLQENPRNWRGNVIILGAGASIQSFPNGDRNNNKLPHMQNMIEIVGLEPELQELGIENTTENFETVYSKLYSEFGENCRLKALEERVRAYFTELQLPDEPTLFDHLILSLRPHDVIFSFNWDPLLFDAYERLQDFHNIHLLPQIRFLHGNVRVGYCPSHKFYGNVDRICPNCHKRLTPSPLLFPIEQKDYETDPFISDAWSVLRARLEDAFSVTIFGYSAPVSDIAAFNAMKDAWKSGGNREHETLFFVDIKPERKLAKTWSPFIFSHHFKTTTDFYQSWIPRHARRSIEALIVPTVEGKFVDDLPIPREFDWTALEQWYKEMAQFEDHP